MLDEILTYLETQYHPLSILLYGSYADETNDEYSDFDCMVIVEKKEKRHDDSIVAGVQLDCFLFTPEEVQNEEDLEVYLTAYDANIVKDNGLGADLKKRVREFVEAHSVIDAEEKQFIRSWILKTMNRARKGDDEGHFRAVAFLWESLTDYCFLRDRYYFGSKKAIAMLKAEDPEGYALFHEAVTCRTLPAIERWALYTAGPEALTAPQVIL